ncbi:MAG: ATP-binding protein [Chloroflexi bacterium HGW-Chloroflexi-6]|nr:MAG: ATP-binding protein [Chloroflexi bacterium HGW-Chloroflexi-6]
MTSTPDLERQYLQAVLSWLDARLEQEVRRWKTAGQNPADRFRGLYITDEQALALAAGRGPDSVALSESEETEFNQLRQQALDTMLAIETRAEAEGVALRLKVLAETFDLDEFNWWAFIVCMAPALDLRYERIYGYLQDDVTRTLPSVDLLLHLLAPADRLARLDYIHYFERHASLQQYRLLLPADQHSGLRQSFRAAPGVVDWLLGAYTPLVALGDWADVTLPPEDESEREAAAAIFERNGIPSTRILSAVKPILCLHGDDPMQQELAARQLAAALDMPLLTVKFQPGEEAAVALEKLAPAVRDARMLEALLYVQGAEILINHDGALLPDAFETLRLVGESVLLGSRIPCKLAGDMPGNDYPLMLVPFGTLSAGERAELWAAMLEEALNESITESDLRVLAGQFALSSGQIIAAASSAMSQALQQSRPLQSADLFAAARFHSGHHLAELAHKIEPRYSWDDLVLPETQMEMLRELVNMVQSRPLVLDEWGLGRKLTAGMGVSALFSGPPGTGKTLAAQIMAHQLGIDLYRIDLSTVVSKYIGETEKNLEHIFSEASQSNAILFFDEADTIFGKRSEVKDAHDRYANIEVGYLLQRMENYSGVSILATNLRANLDDAFTRRLQFIINFPFPDEKYRLKIWQVLMPPDMPRAEDLDLHLMANRFKLAGGSIRNILVSAAFLAASNGGKVEMPHLLHGARRELQKMGKLLTESDFSLR